MLQKIYFLLFILLVVSVNQVMADYDFREGYIVTNNNDTVYGKIDYNKPSKNSQFCLFAKDSLSKYQHFYPSDIKAYAFINSKFFISRNVKLFGETRLLFLEYVVNGTVDLFYVNHKGTDYFYIEKEGELYELSNNDIYQQKNNELSKRSSNRYIGVLQWVMSDADSLSEDINKAKLTYESLIQITKSYHDLTCDESEECLIYYKKEQKLNDTRRKISFGLSIKRISSSNIIRPEITDRNLLDHFTYEINYDDNNHESSTNIIAPGIEMNISKNSRSSLLLGIYYVHTNYSNLKFTTLQFPVLWQYDITRRTKITPFFHAGISVNLTFNPQVKDLSVTYQSIEAVSFPVVLVYSTPIPISLDNYTSHQSISFRTVLGVGAKFPVSKKHDGKITFGFDTFKTTITRELSEIIYEENIKAYNLSLAAGFFF